MRRALPGLGLGLSLGLALAAAGPAARAQGTPLPPEAVAQALALATQAAQALAPPAARVLATPGALDPRLQLAACGRVEPWLSAGQPAWGRTRVGLRCVQGPTAWSVMLPVTVQVWAPAVVLGSALPAGASLDASMLHLAEVDWGAASTKPFDSTDALAGRVLARPGLPGQTLRPTDLQARRWFSLGETVQILGRGAGFAVSTEGQALTHGLEGQAARVRTEGGRVLVGRPVGERRLEVQL